MMSFYSPLIITSFTASKRSPLHSKAKVEMADDDDKLVTKPFKFVTGEYPSPDIHGTMKEINAGYSWYISILIISSNQ
jgi:hypothetical protein